MFNIAIDGPAGAGKSTTSKALAKRLCFTYIDTGALYRAVALFFATYKIAIPDTVNDETNEYVKKFLNDSVRISITKDGDILLNHQAINHLIRTPEISQNASKISAFPACREFLLDLQRNLASGSDAIMEGRDIGTIVLPDADLKIYLFADIDARTNRRMNDILAKSSDDKPDIETIKQEMMQRDTRDSSRKTAPLRPAPDAYQINNTTLTLEQTVDIIAALARYKQNNKT